MEPNDAPKKADILIEGNIIKEISEHITAPKGATVIDATGMIVFPGFIDCHRHTWQTQLRTVAADWHLWNYFVFMRNYYGSCYDAEDVYLGNLVGALESINAGITYLVDHSHCLNSPDHSDAAVKGLQDSGIRATFCYGFYNNPNHPDIKVHPATLEENWRYKDARRIKKEFFDGQKDSVIRFGLAPAEIERQSEESITKEVNFAREVGAKLITAHVAMGRYDRGRHLVSWMGRTNLLKPDMLFSHGSAFTDHELDLIKANGVGIVATPVTETNMGMGLPVAFRASRHGCNSSFGCDIISLNPADMFVQMQAALCAQRHEESEAWTGDIQTEMPQMQTPVVEVLEIATIGGAKSVGQAHEIGSIKVGKKADLCLLKCDTINTFPWSDPYGLLVQYAHSSNVDTVFINGKLLKHEGKLCHVDWPELRRRIGISTENILRRSNALKTEEAMKAADAKTYRFDSK